MSFRVSSHKIIIKLPWNYKEDTVKENHIGPAVSKILMKKNRMRWGEDGSHQMLGERPFVNNTNYSYSIA